MQKNWWKLAVVILLVVSVGVVLATKPPDKDADPEISSYMEEYETDEGDPQELAAESSESETDEAAESTTRSLPRLLNLGASQCVPCKRMEPIRDELKKEYKGKLVVEFIDVWEDRNAGREYGISSIPTLIFYGEDGREFKRLFGFTSKERILETFADHGINLD